jgi:CubicO group peptidase (beta-lactamase class C family)
MGFERHDATTQEQAVRALSSRADLQFAFRSKFRYSGSDYLLLTEIVHAATGSTLSLILTRRVFEPLELDMTMDPSGHLPDMAASYRRVVGGSYEDADGPGRRSETAGFRPHRRNWSAGRTTFGRDISAGRR